MTSMTAILSRSVRSPLRHRPWPRRTDKAGRAAEFSGQFFQEALEPALRNRLPVTALLREENLHEVGFIHDTSLALALPGQLPRSVSVVTHSTCCPKRFM